MAEEGAAPLEAAVRAGGCGGQLSVQQLTSKALPAEAWSGADVLLLPSKLSLPDVQQQQQPGSPSIASGPPSSAATPLLPSLACSSPLAAKAGLRCSPGPRTERGSPGSCAWRPGTSMASGSPTAGGSQGPGGQPRGGSLSLTSQLTKQLVALEDELLVKSDLAEGLACQVRGRSSCWHWCLIVFQLPAIAPALSSLHLPTSLPFLTPPAPLPAPFCPPIA